ncbi:MAG: tRNA (adenosine(37)-N6)-threonylcarbamoyltransferase complex dimerization subunit type 1 TsaB, partial [Oxalobacter sp.]|nr:tRNA (adenosine(37)-N6)-threonylcarbamoyltransferase complex dimerization subunit type 1 TsaB [Oxalobacter sp.]
AASQIVPQGEPVLCGNGITAYADELPEQAGDLPRYPDIYPHAEAIARLAHARFLRGETVKASAIEPLYLRNKVALKTSERLALKEKTA